MWESQAHHIAANAYDHFAASNNIRCGMPPGKSGAGVFTITTTLVQNREIERAENGNSSLFADWFDLIKCVCLL